MVSRKALRLFGQNPAATFTAPRAIGQWKHRRSKAASVGGLFHFPFGFSPATRLSRTAFRERTADTVRFIFCATAGGCHAGFEHCSQLIVFHSRPWPACWARSGHFLAFSPSSARGRRALIGGP